MVSSTILTTFKEWALMLFGFLQSLITETADITDIGEEIFTNLTITSDLNKISKISLMHAIHEIFGSWSMSLEIIWAISIKITARTILSTKDSITTISAQFQIQTLQIIIKTELKTVDWQTWLI